MARLTFKIAALALAVLAPFTSAIDIMLCDEAYFNACTWNYNVPTGECLNTGASADTVRPTLVPAANAIILPMKTVMAKCSITETMNRTGWPEIMTSSHRSSALRALKQRGSCGFIGSSFCD
ncbi:hypothetical protein ARMGADRAFT_1065221 [Armillaria gallica]|uniref:Uncharacterized protein n=1 Tax=Armillaria gallica TaxID=47427 RepID=A0A2H3D2C8_ARMGA|nr:hypothetical protein ARMGADRAFT_1065221 [Armillaria gallica]